MLTENGEQDRPQSSINIIRMHIDTESESLDTFLGMVLRISQLCHTWSILVQMSSMEPSRETAIQLHNSSDKRGSSRIPYLNSDI